MAKRIIAMPQFMQDNYYRDLARRNSQQTTPTTSVLFNVYFPTKQHGHILVDLWWLLLDKRLHFNIQCGHLSSDDWYHQYSFTIFNIVGIILVAEPITFRKYACLPANLFITVPNWGRVYHTKTKWLSICTKLFTADYCKRRSNRPQIRQYGIFRRS